MLTGQERMSMVLSGTVGTNSLAGRVMTFATSVVRVRRTSQIVQSILPGEANDRDTAVHANEDRISSSAVIIKGQRVSANEGVLRAMMTDAVRLHLDARRNDAARRRRGRSFLRTGAI